MDIEGYAKRGLRKGDTDLMEKLTDHILEIKDISRESAGKLAGAVIEEARATLYVKDDIIASQPCGITMGAFGVGSRGRGDFYAHKKIAEVIGKTNAVCDSSQMDDSGVVKAGGQYVVVTVDGMHSRLSDFPFLAGFHCTRASLRDLYVMGAKPVALFSDIHIADDGDVSKIFDYTAGITTVSDLIDVPLVTGSTLRIGGDMVIGDRMTGCVGAVGVAQDLTARIQSKPGDVIMVSEGAGGGTVSTTALYFGMHEVVEKTLNVKFLEACESLWARGLRFELRLIGLANRETGAAALERIAGLRAAGRPLVYDGAQEDEALEAAYGRCAFTVYPSLAEGFGLPVAESLARGRPCLCRSLGALGEVSAGGGCAGIGAAGPAEIAAVIARLLEAPAELAALGAAARARQFETWGGYTSRLLGWMSTLSRDA